MKPFAQAILFAIRARPSAGLPYTELIDFTDSDLNDEGLLQLAGMKNLRFIMAQNTRITQDGITRLQSILPNVRVIRDRKYNWFIVK